jgi:hypothetical protein
VLTLPRRRGARRIRRLKACALALRLYALDTLRWAMPSPAEFQELQDEATGLLRATEWAVRRPSRVRREP